MIPDTAKISITAHIKFLGYVAAEVEGYVYSLDDQPIPDVVTFSAGNGVELEACSYGTPDEDVISKALISEANTEINRSRLTEAFVEWVVGNQTAAREVRDQLRLVEAAE